MLTCHRAVWVGFNIGHVRVAVDRLSFKQTVFRFSSVFPQ